MYNVSFMGGETSGSVGKRSSMVTSAFDENQNVVFQGGEASGSVGERIAEPNSRGIYLKNAKLNSIFDEQ